MDVGTSYIRNLQSAIRHMFPRLTPNDADEIFLGHETPINSLCSHIIHARPKRACTAAWSGASSPAIPARSGSGRSHRQLGSADYRRLAMEDGHSAKRQLRQRPPE